MALEKMQDACTLSTSELDPKMTPIRATISNKENQPKLPEENKPMKQCKWAGTFWLFISQLPALLLRWGGGGYVNRPVAFQQQWHSDKTKLSIPESHVYGWLISSHKHK